MEDEITLMVDTNDLYQDDMNCFYMHPKRLALLRCLSSQEFKSAVIQFSPIDTLTSLNFSYILRILRPGSICEVFVHQPISVMQDYDAKQIEANAKLAGFTGFEQNNVKVENPKDKSEYDTICVSFKRTEKKGVEEEEDEPKDKKVGKGKETKAPAKDVKGKKK